MLDTSFARTLTKKGSFSMEATTFYPQTRQTRKPVYTTRAQKAERMGLDGYGISVPLYARNTFLVHTPLMAGESKSAKVYRVDLTGKFSFCDCYDSRNNGGACKHILFCEKCIRFIAKLEKKQIDPVAYVDDLLRRCEAQGVQLAIMEAEVEGLGLMIEESFAPFVRGEIQ